MTDWSAWEDGDGGVLFIADGPRSPVLVYVRDRGVQEDVLATFTSTEAAQLFQLWIDNAFTETAEANHKLVAHMRQLYQVADQ